MNCTSPTRRAKPSEEGYILVAVMFMLALLIISMAVAVPKIAAAIQRDREVETYHRGLQYRQAIRLYYRKFQRYPPSIDALVKTNNIKFLRKRYLDPITGKDDWKPVFFGQNKAPLAMGFFGQPLGGPGMGGAGLAGIGPSGGNGMIPGATPIGGIADPNAGANPVDPNAPAGQNGASPANPNDPNSPNSPNGGQNPGGNQPFGGQQFGGAGIVGFAPNSPKHSILVYKKKDHYSEWEFTYSYLSEMNSGMGVMPQQPLLPGQAPGTVNPTPAPGPSPGGAPTPTPTPTPQQ